MTIKIIISRYYRNIIIEKRYVIKGKAENVKINVIAKKLYLIIGKYYF